MHIGRLKSFLYTGTALAALVMPLDAFALTQNLTGNGTWASAGTAGGTNLGDASDAAAGDDINIGAFALTVTNDQTANDGGGLDGFTLGAVDGTSGSLTIDTANATDLNITTGAIVLTGAGNVSISNNSVTTQAVTATIGSISTLGSVDIVNAATAAKSFDVTITGALTSAGASTLTAGNFAGASSAALTIVGGSNFSGGMTITGGADAASFANLFLKGASNSGDIILDDGALAAARVTFGGGIAQTVSGTINGAVANEGGVYVIAGSTASFNADIGATAALYDVGVGNGSVTFDGTLHALSSQIAGKGTLTTNGALVTNVAILGDGATININGGITGNIDFDQWAGVVTLGDASNITGNVDASTAAAGTLSFSGASTVSGTIGATNAISLLEAGAVAGKTVTFNDTVNVTTLSVNGTGSVQLNKGITGNIDFGVNDGIVSIADTMPINGTVDAGAVNTGTLTLEGKATIANTMGATNSLKILNMGAANRSVTFNAAVSAATMNVTGKSSTIAFNALGTGDLLFNADADATISSGWTGGIDASIANSGTVTFNTVAPVGITTIGATQPLKRVMLSGVDLTTSGAINAKEFIIGGSNVTTTAAGYTLTKSQKVYFDISNSVGGSGRINLGGANTVDLQKGSIVEISLNNGHTVAVNDTITLIAGGAAAVSTDTTIVSGTPGWSFINISGGNNFAVKAVADTATSSGSLNLARVNTALVAGNADPDILALNNAVDAALTAKEKIEIRESALPVADGGANYAIVSANNQISSIIDTRVAAVSRSGHYMGVASGANSNSNSFWMQAYSSFGIQDRHDSVDGYELDVRGMALGYDNSDYILDGVLGVALNYGRLAVDSENANTTNTGISSYGFNLYSNMNFNYNMFIDGQVSMAYNAIDMKRYNVGGAGGPTAISSTSSYQYGLKLGMGKRYIYSSGLVVTPSIFSSYTGISTSGYSETGAGGLNMTVGDTSSNILDLGGVVKTSISLVNEWGALLKPEVKLGYSYSAINDPVDMLASFSGNPGTSFLTTSAEPAKSTFNLGAGLSYTSLSNWELAGKYDFVFKEDYMGHNGSLRLVTHF